MGYGFTGRLAHVLCRLERLFPEPKFEPTKATVENSMPEVFAVRAGRGLMSLTKAKQALSMAVEEWDFDSADYAMFEWA